MISHSFSGNPKAAASERVLAASGQRGQGRGCQSERVRGSSASKLETIGA